MILNIYKYDGSGQNNIASVEFVTSVKVDHFPHDQISFAEELGGDFIEVEQPDDLDEDDYQQRLEMLKQ